MIGTPEEEGLVHQCAESDKELYAEIERLKAKIAEALKILDAARELINNAPIPIEEALAELYVKINLAQTTLANEKCNDKTCDGYYDLYKCKSKQECGKCPVYPTKANEERKTP